MAKGLNPLKTWALPIGLFFVCLGSPPAAAGPAPNLSSPDSILEKAVDEGRDVIDFRARLRVEARIGERCLAVPVDVYSKSPYPALIKILGIPFQARRNGDLMIPTARVFTDSGDYRLSLARVLDTPAGKAYEIEAVPKQQAPGVFSWTLTVSPGPWRITTMLARNELGESTRVQIQYTRIDGNLVPARVDGQGDLLLKVMLPGGLATWLYEKVTRNEPVSYRIIFSRIRINTGWPEARLNRKRQAEHIPPCRLSDAFCRSQGA